MRGTPSEGVIWKLYTSLYNWFCSQDMESLINEYTKIMMVVDQMVIYALCRWDSGDTFSGYFEGGVRSGWSQM